MTLWANRLAKLAQLLDVDGNPPGGGGAVDSVNGQTGVVVLDAGDVGADVAGAAAAAQAASQPVDADLTAIAALTTTSYGRAFLALADAAAGRTALSLGTAATQATGAFDAAGAAAAAQAASQPLDADLTAIAALTTTSYGRSLLEAANAAALRTLGGLVIGTDVQAQDADLAAIAALTTTTFGRSLLTPADAAAARALLGVSAMSQITISQTPTVTSGAYLAEDVIGGLLTFANAALANGGSGIVQGVTIMCKSPLTLATVPSLELALFNQTFTNIADNGAWAPSDADMANCIGTIPIAGWNVSGNNCIATRFGLGFAYSLVGTSLFSQLITHTGVTLTSTSDIQIALQCIRD